MITTIDRPLRIAYLTSFYSRASDSFIRGEVQQLRQLGCEVHTFSLRNPDEGESVSSEIRRERNQTDDILGHSWCLLIAMFLFNVVHSPLRVLRTLWLAWGCSAPGWKSHLLSVAYTVEGSYLARRMQVLKINHLHNHIGEASATVAMLASSLSGIPFSLTIHGPNEFDRATLLALDEKVSRAAFSIVISRFGRSQLYRWSRLRDWSKIHVVRCGVDERFLEAPVLPVPDNRRLVCVGRLAEQKGQLLLVQAVARLIGLGIDLELRLIGDGPMRDELQSLIRHLHLESQVKILGWKSADEIRDEILACRGCVLPSFAEGLPVVLMEALALHRPVISTWIAGIPELIENEVNGWLVPPGDCEAVAAAMREILETQVAQLQLMGKEGAERVRQNHNARKEAKKIYELITGTRSQGATDEILNAPNDEDEISSQCVASADEPSSRTLQSALISPNVIPSVSPITDYAK